MAIKTPMFEQLRRLVVIPALQTLGLDTPAARNLVLGTAAQESGGRTIAQIGGPALGYFDIEPATADWVLVEVVRRYPALYGPLQTLRGTALTLEQEIAANGAFAASLCRLRYYFVPAKLPANDWPSIAAYWKQFYNTPAGAGTVAEFIANANALIGAPPDV